MAVTVATRGPAGVGEYQSCDDRGAEALQQGGTQPELERLAARMRSGFDGDVASDSPGDGRHGGVRQDQQHALRSYEG